MKVLHIGKYLSPTLHGGLETILRSVLDLTSGDVVNVVLVAGEHARDEVERYPGCEIHQLAKRGDFLFTPVVPSMPATLRRFLVEGVDILALHFPNPMAAISYLLARPFRGAEKLVVFYHSEVAFERFPMNLVGRLYYLFERFFLARADRIVVSNVPMRDGAPQLPRYRDKTVVVHYAIEKGWTDLSDEQVGEVARLKAEHGDRFVLFVGRLVAYKGLETLIDAAREIRGRIVIVGDGPMREALSGRVAQEGLQGKVVFTGGVADVKPYFAACSLLTLPSISRLETFGIVQIEAMAFGKPCVTSDLSTGVTYINVHGETGLAFPVGDASGLAVAVNLLLDDACLRTRLGETARAKVSRDHSPESVRNALLALYREVSPARSA